MSLNSTILFNGNLSLADKLFHQACNKIGFNADEILQKLKTGNVQHLILDNMFQMIDRPEAHSILAGQMAMWQIYSKSPLTIVDYVNTFKHLLRPDVAEFMITHADHLQKEIHYELDFESSYFSVATLIEQYLTRLQYEDQPLEIPQFAWLRVSVGEFCLVQNKPEDVNEQLENVINVYNRFSRRETSPASPTIFNMGFVRGAPSSCMIFAIADDTKDILKVMKEAGLASKNNCGSGIDFSNLRHSRIANGKSSKGIIGLLKVWDDLTDYIDQGGRRPGATTASLKIHHYDIPEFIRLVDPMNEGKSRVSRLNTSIMLNDLFMERCRNGEMWTLFCPNQAKGLNDLYGKAYREAYLEWERKAEIWDRYKKYKILLDLRDNQHIEPKVELFKQLSEEFSGKPIPVEVETRRFAAKDIHDEIADMRIKKGMPYIAHLDGINYKNNMDNEGNVLSLNLCQEVTIPAIPGEQTGCCNLQTVSLRRFVQNKQFQYQSFGQTIQDAVKCLNRVIDDDRNIHKKAKSSNQRNRPIGIGPTGFADMLALMDLPIVDPNHLPKMTEGKYEYVSYLDSAPDYTEQALLERRINPEVDELNFKIWSCMYYNALLGSMEQAKKYGPYQTFPTSHTARGELQFDLCKLHEMETGRKYPFPLDPIEPSEWGQSGSWAELKQDIITHGLRNSLLLVVMPSATKAQMVDDVESVELPMQNIYVRKVISGDYPVINYHMVRDLEQINLWNTEIYNQIIENDGSILSLSEAGLTHDQQVRLRYLKEKYLTMFEVPQKIMIWLAARRQVVIDQAQSLNIYLKNPTKNIIKAIDMYTWSLGLKNGSYYVRTKAAGKPLAITKSDRKEMKIGIREQEDGEMSDIKIVANQIQDKIQTDEMLLREEIVSKTLMTASKPEAVQICNLGGDCVSCQ